MTLSQVVLWMMAPIVIHFSAPEMTVSEVNTVKIYLSSLSTIDNIRGVEDRVQKLGFDIHFDNLVVDDEGGLQSFSTTMTVHCGGEMYDHSSTYEVTQIFPLGVVFIGIECQHGAMVSSISEKENQLQKENLLDKFLFVNGQPTYELFTWDGDLGELQE